MGMARLAEIFGVRVDLTHCETFFRRCTLSFLDRTCSNAPRASQRRLFCSFPAPWKLYLRTISLRNIFIPVLPSQPTDCNTFSRAFFAFVTFVEQLYATAWCFLAAHFLCVFLMFSPRLLIRSASVESTCPAILLR